MSDFSLDPLYDYPQREQFLALAREHAKAVDKNERSPFETLRELGREGLLTLGLEGSLLPQVAVGFDLATEDASTAFSLWAHRSTIAFFNATTGDVPEGLRDGSVSGTTAMAAAFKEASGIGEVGIHASHDNDELVLNGVVAWASNLYDNGVIVAPVAVDDAAEGESERYIVHFPVASQGIDIKYQDSLLALNATKSGFIKLTDVRVPTANILSTDLPGFLNDIIAPFLLVQSSFCLGLGAGALASAAQNLQVSNGVFKSEFEELNSEYQRLRGVITELAQNPENINRVELLQLRLDASHLATKATHLELSVVGGRGYAAGSPTARRLREASFLPVQSPTEGHLRVELERQKQLAG